MEIFVLGILTNFATTKNVKIFDLNEKNLGE